MTRRPVALLVGLALVVAPACTDDDDARADRSTTTTDSSTSASSTTTTSTPTTTTTPATGPAEWVAIAQDLYNRRHEFRSHPDPPAVAAVIDPGCPCYADEFSTVEFFAQEGIRYDSEPNHVLSVTVTGQEPDLGFTFLQIEVQPFPVRLYNRDGSLYQETPAPPPGRVNVAVSPTGPSDAWRIHDEVEVG